MLRKTLNISIKDLFVKKDCFTTASSSILKNYRATYDSQVIRVLISKKYNLTSKVISDEFGVGTLGLNVRDQIIEFFNFKTSFKDLPDKKNYQNCIDPSLPIGGSSSGSVISLFQDGVDLSICTDTGGSSAVPALLHRVYGFKPSNHIITRAGLISYNELFDCVSFITADIDNLVQVWNDLKTSTKGDLQCSSLKPKLLDPLVDTFKKIVTIEISGNQIIKGSRTKTIDWSKIFKFYRFFTSISLFSNLNRYDGFRWNNNELKLNKRYSRQTFLTEQKKYLKEETSNKNYRGYQLAKKEENFNRFYRYYFKILKLRDYFKKKKLTLWIIKNSFEELLESDHLEPGVTYKTDGFLALANILGFPRLTTRDKKILIATQGTDDLILEFAKNNNY